jgi:hypothetical protein
MNLPAAVAALVAVSGVIVVPFQGTIVRGRVLLLQRRRDADYEDGSPGGYHHEGEGIAHRNLIAKSP